MKFLFFVLKIFLVIFGVLLLSQLEYKGRKVYKYASETLTSEKIKTAFETAKNSVFSDDEDEVAEAGNTKKKSTNTKVKIVKENKKTKAEKVAKSNKDFDKITDEDKEQLQSLME